MERFLCDYFLLGSPVIITGCIDHWPARTKWKDIRYLNQVAGDRTVPVEVTSLSLIFYISLWYFLCRDFSVGHQQAVLLVSWNLRLL